MIILEMTAEEGNGLVALIDLGLKNPSGGGARVAIAGAVLLQKIAAASQAAAQAEAAHASTIENAVAPLAAKARAAAGPPRNGKGHGGPKSAAASTPA